MRTECTTKSLEFQALGKRKVIARFDGGAISSRSEEHTSELQSHSFISYAVFCLKKKKKKNPKTGRPSTSVKIIALHTELSR